MRLKVLTSKYNYNLVIYKCMQICSNTLVATSLMPPHLANFLNSFSKICVNVLGRHVCLLSLRVYICKKIRGQLLMSSLRTLNVI